MLNRLAIVSKWLFINVMFFLIMDIFMPSVAASSLAAIITVGYIFRPENYSEYIKLKRPELYTSK